ncbi:MAG TPA: DUF72 domain-containing protein [Gemmatimonadaceae bacterium]|nr:DUF72 domain-containing protein [Gemmatimonadaceae bacterium]
MATIYAGTSGWAYPNWKPDFYPPKTPSAKFLAFYATRVNAVELNYTFRRFPAQKLMGGWIEATPAGFQFAVKAHQNITHVKRLKDAGQYTMDFIGALTPLREAGKLGPVLFQLPPYLRADVALLRDFLAQLPHGVRTTFEFRHASWFTPEVYDLLRSVNAALCQAESETLETPDVQTADYTYLRLRKETYDIASLMPQVASLAVRGDLYVFFKHEETPEGVLNAERLLAAVRQG